MEEHTWQLKLPHTKQKMRKCVEGEIVRDKGGVLCRTRCCRGGKRIESTLAGRRRQPSHAVPQTPCRRPGASGEAQPSAAMSCRYPQCRTRQQAGQRQQTVRCWRGGRLCLMRLQCCRHPFRPIQGVLPFGGLALWCPRMRT